MSAWAVLVAAGRGERFGKPYNKVFHLLYGRSILSHSLNALSAPGLLDGIVLVIGAKDFEDYEELIRREGTCPLVKRVVSGGSTRQESVYCGLCAVPETADIIAVHDAARPFMTESILHVTLEEAYRYGACIPGKPVVDTIKQMDEQGFAVGTPPREKLCAVQTPQCFRKELLVKCHELAQAENFVGTDDASLYERYIGKVRVLMLPECEKNVKVTTQNDLNNQDFSFRVGTGYDVHRLAENRKLVLCGVEVPYEKGLLGHSDADVATHALMDALLGAAGLGDIGRHFPDSDPKYKGICSLLLLDEVVKTLYDKGFSPLNVDITIVAQRPKLKDFLPTMCETLAAHLTIPVERINVKATTTEGLGFEGEGLGISAQAVAMLTKNAL